MKVIALSYYVTCGLSIFKKALYHFQARGHVIIPGTLFNDENVTITTSEQYI